MDFGALIDSKTWRELKDVGAIVTPVGSRVTCNPPPVDTDIDYLVQVDSIINELQIRSALKVCGWNVGGSEEAGGRGDFLSYTKGNVNLIVMRDADLSAKFLLSTRLCKAMNVLDKNHRKAIFEAVMYGEDFL